MKKLFIVCAILLILPITLVWAGSGGKSGAEKKGFVVAHVPKMLGNPYFDAIKWGAEVAAKELGDKFIYTAPDELSLEAQIPIVESLIDQEIDGMMLASTSFEGMAPVCKKMLNAGIPIVTFDADVSPAARTLFINQVSFEDIGRVEIQEIKRQIGSKGKIAIMSGSPQSPNQNRWIEWMKVELEEGDYDGLELVDIVYSDSKSEVAYNEMVDLITAHPDLKGIVIPDSVAMISACAAIEDKGVSGKIKVTGLCIPSAMKDYVLNGTCDKVYLWNNPVYGYLSEYALHYLLTGDLKAEAGSSISIPAMDLPEFVTAGIPDKWVVELDEDGKPFILLGPPLEFTKDNIANWAEIY